LDFLPHYDELWVISDIHMGGEQSAGRNFQIFRRGARLANFIRHVANQRSDEDIALVLNGDIIDSLAEDVVPGYVALDAETALQMMERIYSDPAFAPVWDELGRFVRTPRRHLVLVIGNHDIELALSPVQASLRRRLTEGDAAAQARLAFSTYGGGFACRVGGKRVFCTHGNEVDPWNIVDYSDLGSLNNAINAGRRIDAARWVPNAGTRMVIDIMNKVKERHPFVDLLKPEVKPVLSVLLTLDANLVKQIDLGASFNVVRKLIAGNREVQGLLSAGQELEAVSTGTLASAAVTELLGANLAEQVHSFQTGVSEDELLLAAERDLGKLAPANGAGAAAEGATLGWNDIVSGWLGRIEPAEALRRALLDWLGSDTTFDLTTRDQTFKDIVARVGSGIDFIITGHTHLARAIEYAPRRHYFNCGTWIRLLRLTPQVLADNTVFKQQVYSALAERTMDALDAASIPGPAGTNLPLVLDRTNAVRISRNGSEVKGELLRVLDDADSLSVGFTPEAGGIGE
jgi:UDP-2,3-diacylglucosamine pyrophosphatase LpxH